MGVLKHDRIRQVYLNTNRTVTIYLAILAIWRPIGICIRITANASKKIMIARRDKAIGRDVYKHRRCIYISDTVYVLRDLCKHSMRVYYYVSSDMRHLLT